MERTLITSPSRSSAGNRLTFSPPTGNIFSDDFESGDSSNWDAIENNTEIVNGIGRNNSYGLESSVVSGSNYSVRKDSIGNKKSINIRFYLHPNNADFSSGASRIMLCRDSSWNYIIIIEFGESSPYYVKLTVSLDSGEVVSSAHILSANWNCIEIEWKASSGVGKNDGYGKLFIDNDLKETLSSIDNDTRSIDRIDLGARDTWGTNTGEIYLDNFISNNGHIGPDSRVLDI